MTSRGPKLSALFPLPTVPSVPLQQTSHCLQSKVLTVHTKLLLASLFLSRRFWEMGEGKGSTLVHLLVVVLSLVAFGFAIAAERRRSIVNFPFPLFSFMLFQLLVLHVGIFSCLYISDLCFCDSFLTCFSILF